MVKDRAAIRAQEEYGKVADAFAEGDASAAAFYLGAMAHYIGDLGQYGHTYPDEEFHSSYEGWVGRRTDSFEEGDFESFIVGDGLVRRHPYTAAKMVPRATNGGRVTDNVVTAEKMDLLFGGDREAQEFLDSVGGSLNYTVNVLADVLHRFFLTEVRDAT